MLSVRPDLDEATVRKVVCDTADHIGRGTKEWSKYVGFGRLNAYEALRTARRLWPG